MAKPFEHQERKGRVFRNRFYKDAKHPCYRGNCKIDGKIWNLVMWMGDGDDFETIPDTLSVRFEEPEEMEETRREPPRREKIAPRKRLRDELDDDIPF